MFIKLKFFSSQNNEYLNVINGIIALLLGSICYYFDIHLPLELQTVFSAYFAFIVGRILKDKLKSIVLIKKIYIVLAVTCFIILCALCRFGSIGLGLNNIHGTVFYCIATLSGLVLVWSVASLLGYMIVDSNKGKIVFYISRHSMSIIFWHFLSFKIVTLIQIFIYKAPMYYLACFPVARSNHFWWIAYSIIGVFIPVLMTYILEKAKNFLTKGAKLLW